MGAAVFVRAFKRAQSVLDLREVDFGFTVGGFAERDDADFMVCLRMNERDGAGMPASKPRVMKRCSP